MDRCLVEAHNGAEGAELAVAGGVLEKVEIRLRFRQQRHAAISKEFLAFDSHQTAASNAKAELGACFAELAWTPDRSSVGYVVKLCTDKILYGGFSAKGERLPWEAVEGAIWERLRRRYGVSHDQRKWLEETSSGDLFEMMKKQGVACTAERSEQ